MNLLSNFGNEWFTFDGFTKFCAMYHFSQQRKPKKSLMEMVVSKSKKDITFSTISFLLRMPII
jgi:hypothetical protein